VERCSQLGVLPKLLGDLGGEPAHPIVDGATVMVSIAPFGSKRTRSGSVSSPTQGSPGPPNAQKGPSPRASGVRRPAYSGPSSGSAIGSVVGTNGPASVAAW